MSNPTSLPALLSRSSAENGQSPALVVTANGPQLTHEELLTAVEDTASQLRQAGLSPGQLVSLAFPNSLEFVVLFLAVTRARGVAAPLNAAYTEDEFKFYIEDAESKLLLVPAEGNKAAEAAALSLNLPVASASWKLTTKSVTLTPKARLTPGAVAEDGAGPIPLETDTALFLHTSGTTSRPKGVPLTHLNLATSIANIIATYKLSPSDASLIVMPLFHVHGLMAALLSTLASGGKAILPAAGRFSASTFWGELHDHGATWYTAVPTIHQILLSRHKSTPESSYPKLRFIRSCSSSLAPVVLESLESSFAAPVLEAYAMTEASHQMTSNPLPEVGVHKAGTVGKATGIELAILDDDNNVLPAKSVGEVSIRGANVTLGYKNNPEANKAAFAGGWFHTGDRGFLDEEGYLTLTGRIKELINRGGEKISPMEVDAVLLAFPPISEAVTFGAPDDKYGEEVNAAVVLHKGVTATEAEVFAHTKKLLSAFKVPKRIFFAESVPRTATGKIQRRFVAEHFLSTLATATATPPAAAPPAAGGGTCSASASSSASDGGEKGKVSGVVDGNMMAAKALARMGVQFMFGVVGIPVTQMATAAQIQALRYIGFRNEQAAGYAAGAAGYLTGVPGALLTVSGPGAVHGLAGLSNAQINCWPMIMISGASDQKTVGLGDFQELDQMEAVKLYVKHAVRAHSISEIPSAISSAVQMAVEGRPGPAYVDLPTDVLHQTLTEHEATALLAPLKAVVPPWQADVTSAPTAGIDPLQLQQVIDALKTAERPLLVVGKGAAYAHAEDALQRLVDATGIPFLTMPMAKGVIPDKHPLSAAAARSLALAEADLVLVVGARLNWMLHFGAAPRWSSSARFILIDISPQELELRKPFVAIQADASAATSALAHALAASAPALRSQFQPWADKIRAKAQASVIKMDAILAKDVTPLNFHCSLRIIRDAILAVGSPSPIVVSEGANTMDVGRAVLEQSEARTRLDAGTWGTMGVGLGYAIAAAAVSQPQRLVVAVEGDSAFGFSGMEVEVIQRYALPVVVIVMNNGGVYGGDRRGPVEIAGPYKSDPAPTSFVEGTRYDVLAAAFGAKGYLVNTPEELAQACKQAFSERKPAVINVVIDPFAGSESGRMHSRN